MSGLYTVRYAGVGCARGPEPLRAVLGTGVPRMAHENRWGAVVAAAALIAGGMALVAAPQAQAADWSRCLDGSRDRQAVFDRAADVSGVPVEILLGVSYLETRWDDHGAKVSSAGGYGPMHLTQDAAAKHARDVAESKGDGAAAALTTSPTSAAARRCWRPTSPARRRPGRPRGARRSAPTPARPTRPSGCSSP